MIIIHIIIGIMELHFFFSDFELFEELPTPTISFGGKEGKTVTSLIFKIKTNQ